MKHLRSNRLENPFKQFSTVNPQRENGRREIANDIWRALAVASLTGSEYQVVFIVIDKTWGYGKKSAAISLGHFEKSTRLSRQGIIDAVKRLEGRRMILRQVNGTKTTEYLFNKHWDTWIEGPASQPQLTSASQPHLTSEPTPLVNHSLLDWSTAVDYPSQPRLTSTSQVATPTTEPVKKYIKKRIKENVKEIYIVVFNHWNSLGVIKHKVMTETMQTAIRSALNNYSAEEICQAMTTYGQILSGEEYYWSYKWTLEEFIRRGLEKFMDADAARENYRIKEDRIHERGAATEARTDRGHNKQDERPPKKPIRDIE